MFGTEYVVRHLAEMWQYKQKILKLLAIIRRLKSAALRVTEQLKAKRRHKMGAENEKHTSACGGNGGGENIFP